MLWTSGTAFIIALVLTPIIRDIFHAYNVVDRPGFRKVHAYPIPRLGGLAVAIAYGVVLVWVIGGTGIGSDIDALLWKFLPGAAMILFTGMLDDFFNLSAAFKLGGQILAAAVAFATGLRIEAVGPVALPLAVSLLVTVFWLLLTMNAFNLIDGLDGLCAGMGFVGAAALFAVALVQDNVPLQQATLPLAGALLGFLCYNFSRATMFLGDSGALLIGFLIGGSGILLVERGGTSWNAAVPLLAVAVPLIDLLLAVVRRLLARRPIFSADRGHIHHRLLDRGLTQRRVVSILYAWALAGAVFAFLLGYPSWQRSKPWVVMGCFVTAGWGVWQLRYSEFKVAAKLLFESDSGGAVEEDPRVRLLAAALQRATTEDECWDLLVSAGRDAGWAGLQWIRGQSVWREQVFPAQPPRWSFSLALSDGESLRIDGTLPPAPASIEFQAFVEGVQSAYAARRRAWDQSALS
jgi:UDP-GlcNAc:undecaprenyl-phosphate/decaprenyl-phosphate GlcNAc-1-phosphate transferase